MSSDAREAQPWRISLTMQIICAMLLGGLFGYVWGPSVSFLGGLGKLIIQLIKAAALPMIFFAIIEAILTTAIPARSAFRLFVIVIINASIAACIGISLSNYFQGGRALHIHELQDEFHPKAALPLAGRKIEFGSVVSGYVPDSILGPFVDGNMIAVVLLAVLFGAGARSVSHSLAPEKRNEGDGFYDFIAFMYKLFEKLLSWLVQLVPLAVFGVMCSTVGEYGFAPFHGLSLYVLAALLGLSIQSFFVYSIWIRYFAGISLSTFWSEARKAVVYAFGVNSSLATLPLTLRTLDNLKISRSSSRLGACVGTNFNNDGILLYEAMAVLFVAQAYGLNLTIEQQFYACFLCMVTAMGVAGVPEAGVIALSLVLSTVGMPIEILPLLLTVDWLVARARSVTNVLADMTVSIGLDAWEHRSQTS